MLYTISNFKKRTQALLIASVMLFFISGCASTTPSGVQTTSPAMGDDRAINGLTVSEDASTLKVKISGNSPLRYTSVKQAFPLGIVLYFPGTKLENIDSEYPPEGKLLNSIKTSQQSQATGYDSRIKILLNNDANYDIMRDENGIIVSLDKPEGYAGDLNDEASDEMAVQEDSAGYDSQMIAEEPAVSEEVISPAAFEGAEAIPTVDTDSGSEEMVEVDESVLYPPEISTDNAESVAISENEPEYDANNTEDYVELSAPVVTEPIDTSDETFPATQIQSIDKVSTEKYAEIYIGTDGKIKEYDVFTIPETNEKPARIVCDIYKIKGLKTRGEQAIPVNAHGVQSVRYFSYPDKTRVVVDTTNKNLNAYSTRSENNGLVIHVSGETEEIRNEVADSKDNQEMLSIGSLEVGDEDVMKDDPSEPGPEEILTDEAVDVAEEEPIIEDSLGGESDVVTDDYVTEDTITEPEPVEAETAVEPEIVTYEDFQTTDENEVAEETAYTEPEQEEAYDQPGQVVYDEPQDTMGETEDIVYEELEPAAGSYGDSWVNRIDFSSDKDGKSAIIIGTTNQVDYKINKKDDKTIHFRLYHTKLPKSRKYPFITTRFESAVNRIIPVQTVSMKDNALFIIELRESVPYFVDQQGGVIKINFEASSVPPQPEDMANLPMWKEVLSKTTEIKDIEKEASGMSEMPVADTEVELPVYDETVETPMDVDTVPMEDIAPVEEPLMAGSDMEASESGATALEEQPDEIGMGGEESSVPKEDSFVSWTQKKKYTGEKISVDFFDTDIKNVFRIIRAVSSENFAIDKDVTGKVTMTLDKPVPWDQVLDLVLRMNMLGMVSEGGINRIATLETLSAEEEKRLNYIAAEEKTKLKKKALEPVRTEYILINYSNAQKEILPHVQKLMTAGRNEVTISVDARTNQIIMTDTDEKIAAAKELIQQLDKITPQVIIEARIVEAETSFSRNLGTEWGLNSNPNYDAYNDLLGGTYGYDVAMNNSVASNSSIGINFTKLTGAQFLLNATLMAMETKGEGKIISAPKILTMDNKEATITQGVEIPFATLSSNGTRTEFKRIELKLNVTPHVTSDNKISLKVLIDKNDIGGVTDFGPTITTKKVESELLIGDGDTIVIGGIIKSNKSMTEEGIPFLYKLPVLGWLFKSRIRSEDKQELLIFLTPRIVNYEETKR